MAEQEFFTAAVFAFIGWFVACALAVLRANSLSQKSSKTVCWIVPFLGLLLIVYLVFDGLYGPAGGYRYFAMSLISAVFWVLCFILPAVQLLFGYFAKVMDQSDG